MIVKDYNQYVMSNLARGYSWKDTGVSYVKDKQLQLNMKINKLQRDCEGTTRRGNKPWRFSVQIILASNLQI